MKTGGVVEKRGEEEETKSMPHAPVISTTDDTTFYGIQYFKIQNNIGILYAARFSHNTGIYNGKSKIDPSISFT